jgi:hypothetical protein
MIFILPIVALVLIIYLIVNRIVSKKPFLEWQKVLLVVCIVVAVVIPIFVLLGVAK